MSLPRKELFHLPKDVIYLDGNSLGPLPKAATNVLAETLKDEWGEMLIRAWNTAGWMDLPRRLGNRIAPLIGASEGTIAMGDTLSIKVTQALSAALHLRPDRKVVLSDTGNFPSDLYMAQSLIDTLDSGHELHTVEPDLVDGALNETVAVLMLTQVDYRTGRMHDMAALTAKAQAKGIIVLWDLAHSAGAVPVDLEGSGAEFAIGCTYKYLNGGPGAPAFIYARQDLHDHIRPMLAGWLGHAAPFAMEAAYRPANGIDRLRVGTPAILQFRALDAALDAWEGVSMAQVRRASVTLQELFIKEVEAGCPMLRLASPRDSAQRGSQVSFHFDHGYEAIQALIARGVIGDFRTPDIMRFGFTPLYLDQDDVREAARIITEVMTTETWRAPEYAVRAAVT